jgi:hypothetical protein
MKSHGDEKRLKKVAGASNRATPEGSIVYFTWMKRRHRALRNNGIIWIFFAVIYGLIVSTALTINLLVVVAVLAIAGWVALRIMHYRKKLAAKPKKLDSLHFKSLRIKGAEPTERVKIPKFQAAGVVVEKPQLDQSIPTPVMATLLAQPLGISVTETARLISVGPDRGTLTLPDTFPALDKQRETVEQIITAQTRGTVAFSWRTWEMPRVCQWVPTITTLPRIAPFHDYLAEMEALPQGEFGVGLTAQRKVYSSSHNGDTSWHLRSAAPGAGKSTGFQVKLAQICHKDPRAQVYCVDTKQVSFHDMHGIPGVHIYDDPADHMGEIWKVFFTLERIMRDRYKAVRTHQVRLEDLEDIWLLVDEGNDLYGNLKSWYVQEIKEKDDPTQPYVWERAIVPLINLGRQVHIRGEWMFQNMTDRALGGVSLRDSWGVIGMSGYNKNQWSRIIGTTPMPEPKSGPGRIMMVRGREQVWVQGFYDEPDYLRQYAMANR